MNVLFIGLETSILRCTPRRVILKNIVLEFGEEVKDFRIWCVHRHGVRLMSAMYPTQIVLACTPGDSTWRRHFPQGVPISNTDTGLYFALLRACAKPGAWSAPLVL